MGIFGSKKKNSRDTDSDSVNSDISDTKQHTHQWHVITSLSPYIETTHKGSFLQDIDETDGTSIANRDDRHARSRGLDKSNWPKSCPVVHLDIPNDFELKEYRQLIHSCYRFWVFQFWLSVLNFIATISAQLTAFVTDGTQVLVAFLLGVVSYFGIFFLYFRFLYWSLRLPSSSSKLFFISFYVSSVLMLAYISYSIATALSLMAILASPLAPGTQLPVKANPIFPMVLFSIQVMLNLFSIVCVLHYFSSAFKCQKMSEKEYENKLHEQKRKMLLKNGGKEPVTESSGQNKENALKDPSKSGTFKCVLNYKQFDRTGEKIKDRKVRANKFDVLIIPGTVQVDQEAYAFTFVAEEAIFGYIFAIKIWFSKISRVEVNVDKSRTKLRIVEGLHEHSVASEEEGFFEQPAGFLRSAEVIRLIDLDFTSKKERDWCLKKLRHGIEAAKTATKKSQKQFMEAEEQAMGTLKVSMFEKSKLRLSEHLLTHSHWHEIMRYVHRLEFEPGERVMKIDDEVNSLLFIAKGSFDIFLEASSFDDDENSAGSDGDEAGNGENAMRDIFTIQETLGNEDNTNESKAEAEEAHLITLEDSHLEPEQTESKEDREVLGSIFPALSRRNERQRSSETAHDLLASEPGEEHSTRDDGRPHGIRYVEVLTPTVEEQASQDGFDLTFPVTLSRRPGALFRFEVIRLLRSKVSRDQERQQQITDRRGRYAAVVTKVYGRSRNDPNRIKPGDEIVRVGMFEVKRNIDIVLNQSELEEKELRYQVENLTTKLRNALKFFPLPLEVVFLRSCTDLWIDPRRLSKKELKQLLGEDSKQQKPVDGKNDPRSQKAKSSAEGDQPPGPSKPEDRENVKGSSSRQEAEERYFKPRGYSDDLESGLYSPLCPPSDELDEEYLQITVKQNRMKYLNFMSNLRTQVYRRGTVQLPSRVQDEQEPGKPETVAETEASHASSPAELDSLFAPQLCLAHEFSFLAGDMVGCIPFLVRKAGSPTFSAVEVCARDKATVYAIEFDKLSYLLKEKDNLMLSISFFKYIVAVIGERVDQDEVKLLHELVELDHRETGIIRLLDQKKIMLQEETKLFRAMKKVEMLREFFQLSKEMSQDSLLEEVHGCKLKVSGNTDLLEARGIFFNLPRDRNVYVASSASMQGSFSECDAGACDLYLTTHFICFKQNTPSHSLDQKHRKKNIYGKVPLNDIYDIYLATSPSTSVLYLKTDYAVLQVKFTATAAQENDIDFRLEALPETIDKAQYVYDLVSALLGTVVVQSAPLVFPSLGVSQEMKEQSGNTGVRDKQTDLKTQFLKMLDIFEGVLLARDRVKLFKHGRSMELRKNQNLYTGVDTSRNLGRSPSFGKKAGKSSKTFQTEDDATTSDNNNLEPNGLYLVGEGELVLQRELNGKRFQFFRYQRLDIVNIERFLTDTPSPCTVKVASKRAVLKFVPAETVMAILRSDPVLATRFYQYCAVVLMRRLRGPLLTRLAIEFPEEDDRQSVLDQKMQRNRKTDASEQPDDSGSCVIC